MRTAALVLSAVLLAPAAGRAQAWTETADIARHPYSVDFPAGGRLRLDVRSGDVEILGTAEPTIRVELSGRNAHLEKTRKLKVGFRRNGRDGEMKIAGGPNEDITITVRIPSETDLHARIPFGDVDVSNVRGDMDVELHAGDLTVHVGDPKDYASVDASVTAGDLDAEPFGEAEDGLFRSFRTHGKGRYRLHAHVGAGDLRFESGSNGDAAALR
jgi:hypothetical protein